MDLSPKHGFKLGIGDILKHITALQAHFFKKKKKVTFNCKMVAIKKNSVAKKKSEGENTS